MGDLEYDKSSIFKSNGSQLDVNRNFVFQSSNECYFVFLFFFQATNLQQTRELRVFGNYDHPAGTSDGGAWCLSEFDARLQWRSALACDGTEGNQSADAGRSEITIQTVQSVEFDLILFCRAWTKTPSNAKVIIVVIFHETLPFLFGFPASQI